MARIRTIKPEFPQSESMGRVSRDARLLFVLLWTMADDAGRARAASRMLASLLFPYDDDAPKLIEGWLGELEREGCIRRYEVDGNAYLDIPKWSVHQRIDRPSPSRFPEYRESSRALANARATSSLDQGPWTRDQDQRPGGDRGLVAEADDASLRSASDGIQNEGEASHCSSSSFHTPGPEGRDTDPEGSGLNAGSTPAEAKGTQRGKESVSSGTSSKWSKRELEAEFETWWSNYPRRVAKGHARVAYAAARKKADAKTLLEGARRYAASVAGVEPKFVRHPATWLNGEGWHDEYVGSPRKPAVQSPRPGRRDIPPGWSALKFAEATQAEIDAAWERIESEHRSAPIMAEAA